MEIKIIQNKKEWNTWLSARAEPNNFLQSWDWGDVLITEGKRVERLAVVEDEQVLAQAQIVYTRILFGWQYAFCPKGIIGDGGEKAYITLSNYLKNKNCIFLSIEPESLRSKYFKKTIDINPAATLVLDLTKTEEELLGGMHSKTRYNVHLAEKKNLKISKDKNLEVFLELMNKTGSRDKFSLHHREHYAKVLQSPIIYQLTAYENTKPVACAVFAQFGNTFTYLYGASDYEYRNLMAPYLLQWEGINMGKDLGCKYYDFFGVAPLTDGNYDSKHQYAGVTRFKLGFGGASHQVPGTFDFIISKNKYKVYSLLRLVRRLF